MAGFCTVIVLGFDAINKVAPASVASSSELDLVTACRPCTRTKLLDLSLASGPVVTLDSIEQESDTEELYVLRFPSRDAAGSWIVTHANELKDKKVYLVDPSVDP
jgi:hypothetical protein